MVLSPSKLEVTLWRVQNMWRLRTKTCEQAENGARWS